MKQSSAPLWDALRAYRHRHVVPFHTPGHKLHSGVFSHIAEELGEGIFALDPSDEVENEQHQNDFESVLEEAQRLAAELFEARDSLFLVNGTTGGLHYLLYPTTGKVVLPRFSHQSVYASLMLSESEPVYIPTEYDQEWQIPLPPTIDQFRSAVYELDVQAAVLTYPTYYGTAPNLVEMTSSAHERGTKVFADEAHGAHFLFSKELPPTALQCGADAVVQSTHKTLGSLTQTSMLHCNDREWFKKVKQARRILQTTSPSLIFLAILDEVRRTLATQGAEMVNHAVNLAERCRVGLSGIPYVELLPERLQSDPTKVVFSLRTIGLTGIEVERLLRTDYNIQVEMSDFYNVLALITVGDTEQVVKRLVDAVQDIVDRRRHLGGRSLKVPEIRYPHHPPAIMTLREASFHDVQMIRLNQAENRISGGFLTPYPPGVPLVVPGERITADIVEYVNQCQRMRWQIRGLESGEVAVVKDRR